MATVRIEIGPDVPTEMGRLFAPLIAEAIAQRSTKPSEMKVSAPAQSSHASGATIISAGPAAKSALVDGKKRVQGSKQTASRAKRSPLHRAQRTFRRAISSWIDRSCAGVRSTARSVATPEPHGHNADPPRQA